MAYTSDKEDKNLFSRADDIVSLSELRYSACFTGFLNERERYVLSNHLSYAKDKISFFGGYEGASRVVMCSSPYEVSEQDFPIEKLCYKFRGRDNLSHRDFLGSLMGLGIERGCVGDIVVNGGFAVIFVKSEISSYIKSQLMKVGRAGVKLIGEDDCDISYEASTEKLNLIVSSMRLDVIVAALSGLSREKTASLILSGKVFLNYSENKNVSCILKSNDVLSIRGKGKYIIKEQSGATKKGRLKIDVEHYR